MKCFFFFEDTKALNVWAMTFPLIGHRKTNWYRPQAGKSGYDPHWTGGRQ